MAFDKNDTKAIINELEERLEFAGWIGGDGGEGGQGGTDTGNGGDGGDGGNGGITVEVGKGDE